MNEGTSLGDSQRKAMELLQSVSSVKDFIKEESESKYIPG